MDPQIMLGVALFAILAGIIGTTFGIGGGIIMVPALTIVYGLSPVEAAAISLVSIVATSCGGAIAGIKNGVANIRLGLLLEITTTIGAIAGALVAIYLDSLALTLMFAAIVVYSAIHMLLKTEKVISPENSKTGYDFSYHDMKSGDDVPYSVQNVKPGLLMCTVAGAISTLTGMGGGSVKIPVMNAKMGIPIKAATATSTYMIGITAFSGALFYFITGNLTIPLAAMAAVGALIGSCVGNRIIPHIKADGLRKYFSIILLILAAVVLLNAGGIL